MPEKQDIDLNAALAINQAAMAANNGVADADAYAFPAWIKVVLEIKGDTTGDGEYFRIKSGVKMGKLMNAFAKRNNLDIRTIHFYYGSERIGNSDTPEKLGLVDESLIEVYPERLGALTSKYPPSFSEPCITDKQEATSFQDFIFESNDVLRIYFYFDKTKVCVERIPLIDRLGEMCIFVNRLSDCDEGVSARLEFDGHSLEFLQSTDERVRCKVGTLLAQLCEHPTVALQGSHPNLQIPAGKKLLEAHFQICCSLPFVKKNILFADISHFTREVGTTTIITKEGGKSSEAKKIPVLKEILSMLSPYFERYFYGDLTQTPILFVDGEDLQMATIDSVISRIIFNDYSKNYELIYYYMASHYENWKSVNQLIKSADRFIFPSLVDHLKGVAIWKATHMFEISDDTIGEVQKFQRLSRDPIVLRNLLYMINTAECLQKFASDYAHVIKENLSSMIRERLLELRTICPKRPMAKFVLENFTVTCTVFRETYWLVCNRLDDNHQGTVGDYNGYPSVTFDEPPCAVDIQHIPLFFCDNIISLCLSRRGGKTWLYLGDNGTSSSLDIVIGQVISGGYLLKQHGIGRLENARFEWVKGDLR